MRASTAVNCHLAVALLVAGDLPRRDFGDEFSLVWNAAVETL